MVRPPASDSKVLQLPHSANSGGLGIFKCFIRRFQAFSVLQKPMNTGKGPLLINLTLFSLCMTERRLWATNVVDDLFDHFFKVGIVKHEFFFDGHLLILIECMDSLIRRYK